MDPVVLLILAVAAYFLPLLIAMVRRKTGRMRIFIVNLCLGWSLIGWVIALAMTFGSDTSSHDPVVQTIGPDKPQTKAGALLSARLVAQRQSGSGNRWLRRMLPLGSLTFLAAALVVAAFLAVASLQEAQAQDADTAPTVSDTSAFIEHTLTVGQSFSITLPAADAGSGNGGPYDYLLWHKGQGRNFHNGIDGITFNTANRTISGVPRVARVYELSYVIHDADANRNKDDAFHEKTNLRLVVTLAPPPTPIPTPTPQPPAWVTTDDTAQLRENDKQDDSLLTLRATDPDGDDSRLTYTIITGDTNVFSLVLQTTPHSSASLRYDGPAQDYESLSDPDAFATVTVRATDEDGNTVDRAITVSVTDVNDAPVFTAGAATGSLPENSDANVNVGGPIAATDQDGDTLTYSLSGPDAAAFDIDAGTGQVTTKTGVTYDFETKATYSVTVDVNDGAVTSSIPVTVSLTDMNDPPAFTAGDATTGSLPENSDANVNVGGPIVATDQDSDALTYSLTGPDAAAFDIDADTGQVTTKTGVTYDFETKATYTVTVNVDDGAITSSIPVTVSVTDMNDPPAFTAGAAATGSLPENSDANVNVGGPIVATDQDGDALTYSLTGADATAFDIDSDTGQITTKDDVIYDFETKPTLTVTVDVDDGAVTTSIPVTVRLTNVNEPPTVRGRAAVAYPENLRFNVGLYRAIDPDAGAAHTWSLEGPDAASFSISNRLSRNRVLRFITPPDFETQASYAVTVTTTDNGNPALSGSIDVTVTVVDVNEPPAVSGDAEITYAENGAGDVATYSVADPDTGATHTWSLEGADAAAFSISDGVLTFTSPPDYENPTDSGRNNVYEVTVKVADNGTPPLADTIAVSVTVTDLALHYRQVRTWTGRNLENDADVTLTTYGAWGTSSTPAQAPDITSTESTETRTTDSKVRKTITWTDGANFAFQRTDWYAPTRTETYWETERYSVEQVRCYRTFRYPETGNEVTLYGPWGNKADLPPFHAAINCPSPPAGLSFPADYVRGGPEHRTIQRTREVQHSRTITVTPVYAPTNGPTENTAGTESKEFATAEYRQVRTWTGRTLGNTDVVTLTNYGTWSTSSTPPQDAPNITSKETTETRTADDKVRKTITWTDESGNSAYQRTDWYAPTRTETYWETVYYTERVRYTVTEYRFTYTTSSSPATQYPNHPHATAWYEDANEAQDAVPDNAYDHALEFRNVTRYRNERRSRQEQRTRTVNVTPVYAPNSGPTENASTTESQELP